MSREILFISLAKKHLEGRECDDPGVKSVVWRSDAIPQVHRGWNSSTDRGGVYSTSSRLTWGTTSLRNCAPSNSRVRSAVCTGWLDMNRITGCRSSRVLSLFLYQILKIFLCPAFILVMVIDMHCLKVAGGLGVTKIYGKYCQKKILVPYILRNKGSSGVFHQHI
jgi:hypothetical protein